MIKIFSSNMGRVLVLFSIILACLTPCLSYGEEVASDKSTAKIALGGEASGGGDTALPDLFTGAMSYQIPIEVPLGRNGMDPGLALSYNSRGGNGWVGVGWELSVGAIERSTRHGVDYIKDEYLLRRSGSASELVKTPDGEYRSKIESDFMRIQKLDDGSFKATNKQGVMFFFGRTDNSRIFRNVNSKLDVFRWALDRIEDTNGNFISFTYSRDGMVKDFFTNVLSSGQLYLDHIDYNGNQIKFYLDDRDDKPDMYTSKFLIKTGKRLKTIDVLANGARIRKYELGYDVDPTKPNAQYSVKTGRSLLTTVTQYNKDGGTLPPIKLSYSSNNNFVTRNWSTTPYLAADNLSDKKEAVITGDFDGDGKTDVAHARNEWGWWRVSRSTGSEFETKDWFTAPFWAVDQLFYSAFGGGISLENEQVITGDFNGDGKTDVAHSRSEWGGWRVSLSNSTGTEFDETKDWSTDWSTSPYWSIDNLSDRSEQIVTGDFNGDGKTDVAHTRNEWGAWRVSLSNSAGTGFEETKDWLTTPYWAVDRLSDGSEQVITGDFNGDGKTDVAHSRNEWGAWRVSLSTGSGFVTEDWPTDGWAIDRLSDGNERVVTGDFNGDGLTDVAHTRGEWGGWRVSLSTGSGFKTEVWPTDGWAADNLADGNEQVITGDFNGDGKTDIAHSRSEWGGWRVSLSTGSGFKTEIWSTDGWAIHNLSDGDERVITGDFNGDGLTDVAITRGGWSNWRMSGNSVLTSQIPDMLVAIDNGSGGVSTIDYIPSTLLANNTLPFPVQIVSSITTNDGNNNISTTTFDYADGYYHIGERDFRGFNHVTVKGPVDSYGNQKNTETWFHQGNDTTVADANGVDTNNPNVSNGYMKGKPYRIRITDGNGNTYSETETVYAADRDNAAPWFNPPSQVNTYTCDGNVTGHCKGTVNAKHYRSEYQYDSEPNATEYGNLTYEKRHGDYADTNDDTTIYRTYSPNSTNWIIGFPTNEKIFQGIGTSGTKLAETRYFYDGGVTNCASASTNQNPDRGRLTRIERWLHYDGDADLYIEERMAYYSDGNLFCRRDPKGNITTIDYDPGSTFPITITNPLGQQSFTQYYGVNGVIADKGLYGQVKSVIDPNGAKTTKEYDAFGRPLTETRDDNTSTSWDYRIDGIIGSQRVRVTTSDGLWAENYFDGFGRTFLTKTKGPEAKIIETKTVYDARGAVSKTSLPYIGLETLRYVVTEYDAIGRVKRTEQESPADKIRSLTCYDKDVTERIDPNNHRRREVRDSGGRLVKIQEYTGTSDTCSSAGSTQLYATTTYQYDVLGNLLLVTDAKGNRTEITYDSFGRKRYMKDPDMGVWRYTYDVNGNLETQTDAKGQVITFDYDELNRLKTKKHGEELVLTNTYDEFSLGYFNKGRLTKMTDLSGQTVYKYDNMGRVTSSTKTIDGTAYNQGFSFVNGRLDTITYPDNEIVKYTYDAGYLQKVADITGVPKNYILYYNFDSMGRPWNASYGAGGASSQYTFNEVTKRLSSLRVLSPNQGLLIDNSDYQYDNKGNIKSITDSLNKVPPTSFMSESYTLDPSRAHAIGSTGSGRVFQYDNNGNVKNDGQRTIEYNYDNMPKSVDGVSFTYDGNSTRVKKRSPDITTVYIDKLYECTNGTCAKFIFAGGTRVAMKVGNEVRYYHPDHQGSTSVVTDTAGNRINDIAYFPFGEMRQPIDSTSVSHMYTGQELDSATGLYNYNARLYDPDMGRFMTPDTFVSNPANPQSLNRYSYVLNNPINYLDPSGYWRVSLSLHAGVGFDLSYDSDNGHLRGGVGVGVGGGVSVGDGNWDIGASSEWYVDAGYDNKLGTYVTANYGQNVTAPGMTFGAGGSGTFYPISGNYQVSAGTGIGIVGVNAGYSSFGNGSLSLGGSLGGVGATYDFGSKKWRYSVDPTGELISGKKKTGDSNVQETIANGKGDYSNVTYREGGLIGLFLNSRGFDGITLGNTIIARNGMSLTTDLGGFMSHELVHVDQWNSNGYAPFAAKYIGYSAYYGYKNNPYEKDARDKSGYPSE